MLDPVHRDSSKLQLDLNHKRLPHVAIEWKMCTCVCEWGKRISVDTKAIRQNHHISHVMNGNEARNINYFAWYDTQPAFNLHRFTQMQQGRDIHTHTPSVRFFFSPVANQCHHSFSDDERQKCELIAYVMCNKTISSAFFGRVAKSHSKPLDC